MAEVLKTAGYVTGMTGKWGLGEPNTTGLPNDQGFDEWFGYLNQRRAHSYCVDFLWLNRERYPLPSNAAGQRQQYTHDLFTDFALDFVTRHAREPFFLYVPYTIPHGAYEVPDMGPYGDKPWTKKERTYAAMVSRMDGDIGRLLALLGELDLKDRTLLFFCSDNGAANNWLGVFDSNGPLRGKKRDVYEGGIRVPMIVTGPGVPAGQVSDAPWYFADLLPTLADWVDVETPAGVDGVSVLPLLKGEAQDLSKRLLYWEFYEGGFMQAAHGVRGWLIQRRADGTYTVTFKDEPSNGDIEVNQNIGLWGISGPVYFTIMQGWIEGDEISQADPADPYYYDAYKIIALQQDYFEYESFTTNNRFVVRRVSDDFSPSDL